MSQSCVFDLGLGRHDVRPDAAMAYRACENASYASPEQGNAGVGTGCSVGKYRGMQRAMKSGFGAYALQAGAIKVGALVAVNALGDIFGEDGKQIAGLLNAQGDGLSGTLEEMLSDMDRIAELSGMNTTIGVVVTNAKLPKAQLCKVAGMAHNGYARAIRPVHTTFDGDSIYALSTGSLPGDVNVIGAMAAYAMERAIVRAVRLSPSAYGIKGIDSLEARR